MQEQETPPPYWSLPLSNEYDTAATRTIKGLWALVGAKKACEDDRLPINRRIHVLRDIIDALGWDPQYPATKEIQSLLHYEAQSIKKIVDSKKQAPGYSTQQLNKLNRELIECALCEGNNKNSPWRCPDEDEASYAAKKELLKWAKDLPLTPSVDMGR
jgi:hypothetical protein